MTWLACGAAVVCGLGWFHCWISDCRRERKAFWEGFRAGRESVPPAWKYSSAPEQRQ